LVHLVAGELSTLSGLRTLRHLDLQLAGVHQIMRGDAEPPRRDLLDGAVPLGEEPPRILATLTAVAAAADAVHRDREGLMGLDAQRTERHRPRREALDDLLRRLHLLDRYRGTRHQVEETAQVVARVLLVRDPGELLVRRRVVLSSRLLELGDDQRAPVVVLTLA